MMHFDSDYMHLCHPAILKRMAEVADTPFSGYGADEITHSAEEKIKTLCQCPEAEVYFLTGGTQTNMVVIDALLKPWEGVLCADSGHIAVHEAGAIEFTGHKVLTLKQEDGKISASAVENYLQTFYSDPNWEHMVAPGMVYLTHPTECGTIYTLTELEAIHRVCQAYKIPLYIDGARLGYGLAANTEVLAKNAGNGNANKGEIAAGDSLPSLADIARLADAFYIGGTKCGAMYGEAVVFPHPTIAPHFFTQIKRHGALLAKGWGAALQFDVLFSDANRMEDTANRMEDTLYYRICRHGVEQAARVRKALIAKGYRLMPDSPTNQLFVELTQEKAQSLSAHLTYGQWEPPHGNLLTIRFATSWATNSEDITRLIELL